MIKKIKYMRCEADDIILGPVYLLMDSDYTIKDVEYLVDRVNKKVMSALHEKHGRDLIHVFKN